MLTRSQNAVVCCCRGIKKSVPKIKYILIAYFNVNDVNYTDYSRTPYILLASISLFHLPIVLTSLVIGAINAAPGSLFKLEKFTNDLSTSLSPVVCIIARDTIELNALYSDCCPAQYSIIDFGFILILIQSLIHLLYCNFNNC